MRQSQRQRDKHKCSTIEPLQSKRVKYATEPPPKQLDSTLSSDDELESILQQWFHCMVPHVWYKILPSTNDDVCNIAFAMGQPWDLVSAVLLRLNFLVKYKDDYRISHDKFQEFSHETNCNRLFTS